MTDPRAGRDSDPRASAPPLIAHPSPHDDVASGASAASGASREGDRRPQPAGARVTPPPSGSLDAFPGAIPVRMSSRPGASQIALGAAIGKGVLDPATRALIDPRALVWLPGCFPSFAAPEQYVGLRTVVGNRVGLLSAAGRAPTPPGTGSDGVPRERIATGATSGDPEGDLDGARDRVPDGAGPSAARPPRAFAPAALANLRCGVDAGDGSRCGRALSRAIWDVHAESYRTIAGCRQDGHAFEVEAGHLVDAVIRIVAAAYAPAAMRDAVANARGRADARRARLKVLSAEVARLDGLYLKYARQEEDVLERVGWSVGGAPSADGGTEVPAGPGGRRADGGDGRSRDGADYDLQFCRERRRDVQRRRARVQGERVALTAALAEGGGAADDEAVHLEAVATLAAAVGPLLSAVRDAPEVLRAVLSALTASVTIAPAASRFLVVEVALPNGAVTRRLVATGPVRSLQPARVWAATRLAAGDSPVTVEARLVAAGAGRGLLHGDGREAVQQALLHRYFASAFPAPPPRSGFRPYPDVAARVGAEPDAVLDAALRGALGPAEASAGVVTLAPDDAELETEFPDYARRVVAARAGWSVADTVVVGSAAARLGLSVADLEGKRRQMVRDAAGRRYLSWATLASEFAASAAAAPDAAGAFARAVTRAVAAAGYDAAAAGDWHPVEALYAHLRRRGALGGRRPLSVALRDGLVARVPYTGPAARDGDRPPRMVAYCPAAVHASTDRARVQAWLRGADPPPRAA